MAPPRVININLGCSPPWDTAAFHSPNRMEEVSKSPRVIGRIAVILPSGSVATIIVHSHRHNFVGMNWNYKFLPIPHFEQRAFRLFHEIG